VSVSSPIRIALQIFNKCHAKSVTAAAVQAREHSPIDITSHDFWSQPFAVHDETFAQLRSGEGLTWHRPFASMFPMEEPATGHSRGALDPMPAEIQRFASFFLSMDPPQHQPCIGGLISSAFTPLNVRQIEDQIPSECRLHRDDLVLMPANGRPFVAAVTGAAADADDHGHARCAEC